MLSTPSPEVVDSPAVAWNILYPGSYARRPDDPSGESWFIARAEPATFPRMSGIRIISRAFPWMIDIKSEAAGKAITCRDVLDQLHNYLGTLLSPLEMDDVTLEHRSAMSAAYRASRSHQIVSQEYKDSPGMRKIDWLCKTTVFEGIEEDKDYIVDRLSVFVPGTFVLRCGVKKSDGHRRVAGQDVVEHIQGGSLNNSNSGTVV